MTSLSGAETTSSLLMLRAWRVRNPHRRADAAGPGVVDQGLEGGKAGHADVDRQLVARLAQGLVPGDDRRGLEAELGGDVDLGVAALGKAVLPGDRLGQRGLRDIRAALGMAGDADAGDAVLSKRPVSSSSMEDSKGPSGVDTPPARATTWVDPDLALQLLQVVLEGGRLGIERAAKCGTGSMPSSLQALGGGDGVGEVRARQKGDRDRGAGADAGRGSRRSWRRARRGLDREAVRKSTICCLRRSNSPAGALIVPNSLVLILPFASRNSRPSNAFIVSASSPGSCRAASIRVRRSGRAGPDGPRRTRSRYARPPLASASRSSPQDNGAPRRHSAR